MSFLTLSPRRTHGKTQRVVIARAAGGLPRTYRLVPDRARAEGATSSLSGLLVRFKK
jgi:hypothetical protein